MSSLAQLFSAAVGHHQRGQFAEAEALYRQILAADPQHAASLHYAGVAAHQQGRTEEAADLIQRSLAQHEDAEARYHLGLAYAGLRRFADTAEQNRRAIALKPDYLEAHMNLGNALKELGRLAEAAECYERAIAINPNTALLHYNLANTRLEQRDYKAAAVSFERALALQPKFPQALQNYGSALLLEGRVDDALAKFEAALALAPNFPEALNGGALALLLKERADEALVLLCRSLELNPTDDAKLMFVDCIKSLSRIPAVKNIEKHLGAAINDPWCRPRELAGFAANLLPSAAAIGAINAGATAASQLETLAANRLLRAIMENAPVVHLQLERALTAARRELLRIAAAEESVSDSILIFACALARQCFVNEYIFDLDDAEAALASAERDRLPDAPSPLRLAAVGTYFPLHEVSGAERLLDRAWPAPVDALLSQQVREPRQERTLREAIPLLTPIDDEVSRKVRRQYEENPYPRWTKIPRLRSAPLDRVIQKILPRAPLIATGKNECNVLIAGCGTGQEPLDLAQNIAGAKVLAVDLSEASLAHAARKTLELRVTNIDYAQADILQLPSLDRKFDLLVCAGVLHHMADPLAAWRGLFKLVRPGGLMMVALYSEAARKNVLAAQEFVKARGFPPTTQGIRQARRALIALPDDAPAKNVIGTADFFSASECRDALFHVVEHCLTIPQIKSVIDQSGARFLGFRARPNVAGQYLARFPDDPAMIDLDNWHVFELAHPETFIEMYQFVLQIPPD